MIFHNDRSIYIYIFETFSTFFKDHIPRLFAHFKELQFTPEFYLIEWYSIKYYEVTILYIN